MTEPSLIERERQLLRDLLRLSAERAAAESSLEQTFRTRTAAINRDYHDAYQNVIVRFASDKEAADRELEKTREMVQARYESEREAAVREHEDARLEARAEYGEAKDSAKSAFQEARWTTGAMLEASKGEAENVFREEEARITSRVERFEAIRRQADSMLADWNLSPGEFAATQPAREPGESRKVQECLAEAEYHLAILHDLMVPRFLKKNRLLALSTLLWLLLILPLGWLIEHLAGLSATLSGLIVVGVAASTVLVLLLGMGAWALLATLARLQVQGAYQPLLQAVNEGQARCRQLLDRCSAACQEQVGEARRRFRRELRRLQREVQERILSARRKRADLLPRLKERCRTALEAYSRRSKEEIRRAEEQYQARRAEIQQLYESDSQALHAERQRQLDQIKAVYEDGWRTLMQSWRANVNHLEEAVAAINGEGSQFFPEWDDPVWPHWSPPTEVPSVVRFGRLAVNLSQVPQAISRDQRLRDSRLNDFSLPAVCPFPEGGLLLFKADEANRGQVVAALQAATFRLLTAMPPGKVRFTILDPEGLGESFAAFMHLADHDPDLVGGRIWTEPAHVEGRLADLTAHVENVIQKCLRNQYATLAAYNAEAGEVAEPFRVLVVADFPANFSTESARRLLSLAQSGPRCGVFVLLGLDQNRPLPKGFDLAELEQSGTVLTWDRERFTWRDQDFSPYPLTVDALPEANLVNRILERIGEAAVAAKRVEVPFEFIAPDPEQYWTADSRHGIAVPLGRAGATRRQWLKLGQGTSQHALVAGKTGSGKSTLLHALITDLALLYSPEEVELFLIDFKKGVEFKTYASHELPHARVIAIESEREFGLSVLQRLDAELKRRGDLFRAAGTQDVASFRQANPGTPLPRILLIVDEFQEFFVEDDRLAQDAAGLLDRLVRQGRAFGLHVLLGSQTLGGAYSLARSTIDQMAVRIALQCSEADAMLILSSDNSAASLLSRPGEAIYNDANGLAEGNNPFQVVWLPEERREHYLGVVRGLAQQRGLVMPPAVVFEGNAPADVEKNSPLNDLLEGLSPSTGDAVQPARAWLGEALALKDPTAVTFPRHHGSNLLLVGQQDEAALGILTTALVSLAARMEPNGLTDGVYPFYVVDGSGAAPPTNGVLSRLPDVLAKRVRLTGWRDLPVILAELTAEMERRRQDPEANWPSIFVVLYGLHRCRNLRREEDDFGFTRRDEAPSPPQQFAELLREGPPVGLHVLLWCDSLANLQRALDRPALRELSLRVAFQMSVADSSNLIDTPQASKLGMHRALLASEEDGRLEKFRPYGPPTEAWLERVKRQLRQGAAEVA
jgi:hypothetical protein